MNAEPRHLQIARSYLGLKEVPGKADNPKIMAMYRALGHSWVEHDEVAWCAAFVGFCLEQAGEKSTRKLNARSYATWGIALDPDHAKPGAVAVFTRGKNKAQGHVAFFLRKIGNSIEVLGGNQSNAVTIARYPDSLLIGLRGRDAFKPDMVTDD